MNGLCINTFVASLYQKRYNEIYRKGFLMKSRVLLKAVTISLMMGSVLTILFTVAMQWLQWYPVDLMAYHMTAGGLFLSILPIHVYMMRQKLKKLSEQLVTLATSGEVSSACSSQLLPNALHSKSLSEFCRFLGLDCPAARMKLNREGILVVSTEISIEAIATANRTDAARIFAIMLQKESAVSAVPESYNNKLVFAA